MTPAPDESPEPSEEPETSPEPTLQPTPQPTPEPTPAPTVAPTEAPKSDHEHSFSAVWSTDANNHWHSCDCGERADEAAHSFKWETVSVENGVATQEGVCRVCGYTDSKQVTVNDAHVINKVPMGYVIGGLLGLMLVLVVVESVKRAKRR